MTIATWSTLQMRWLLNDNCNLIMCTGLHSPTKIIAAKIINIMLFKNNMHMWWHTTCTILYQALLLSMCLISKWKYSCHPSELSSDELFNIIYPFNILTVCIRLVPFSFQVIDPLILNMVKWCWTTCNTFSPSTCIDTGHDPKHDFALWYVWPCWSTLCSWWWSVMFNVFLAVSIAMSFALSRAQAWLCIYHGLTHMLLCCTI